MTRLRFIFVFVVTLFITTLQPGLAQDTPFLPDSLQVITPENAPQLERVARLGRGALLGAALIEDEETLIVFSTEGIWRYPADDLGQSPAFNPFEPPLSDEFFRTFYPSDFVVVDEGRGVATLRVGDLTGTFSLMTAERLEDDATIEAIPNQMDGTRLSATTADGRVTAYIPDDDARIVLVDNEANEERDANFPEFLPRNIGQLLLNNDGSRLYVVGRGIAGAIYVIDVVSGEVVDGAGGYYPLVNDIALSADGSQLITAEAEISPLPIAAINPGNGARVYELGDGVETNFLPGLLAVGVDVNDKGQIAVSESRGVRVWNEDASLLYTDEANNLFTRATFSDDGSLLALAAGLGIQILDSGSLEVVTSLPSAGSSPVGIHTFTWDGNTLIYVDYDGTVRLWDAATQTELGVSPPFENSLRTIAFNPAQRFLATFRENRPASTAEIAIFDLDEGIDVPVVTFESLRSREAMAFSPDGSLLVAAADPGGDLVGPPALIYDTATGALVNDDLRCGRPLAFTPDGRALFCVFGAHVFAYGVGS